jgi:hypothetical protein
MSKNEWKRFVGAVGRVLLAFAFVISQAAWAGQNPQTKGKADSPQQRTAQQVGEKQPAATTAKTQSKQAQGEESESSVAEEKSSGDGRHEGIKVHGHWTIEVLNPDGTVAAHRDFHNALLISDSCCGGSGLLASILGRAELLGPWEVELSGNTPLCAGNGECWIAEPPICNPGTNNFLGGLGQSAANTSCNLGLSMGPLQANGQPTAAAVLSGSITASTSGSITNVSTWNISAAGPTPTLNSRGYGPVTAASLPSPVSVAAGQTVQVTVQISLS